MSGDRAALKEARLLRALAAALAGDPRLSYQRLAEAVGVSRRTLYRLAPTREALFERLRREAVAANQTALDRAAQCEGSALQALAQLTDEFVHDADLYGFWTVDTWGKGPFSDVGSDSNAALHAYREAMAELFCRGQREGQVRQDLPVIWIIQSYDGLLSAAAGSKRNGTVAPADLSRFVLETLLRGITPADALSA